MTTQVAPEHPHLWQKVASPDKEAITLIDRTGSPLRATIPQDTNRLAAGAVDILQKLHRGRNVPRRTILHAKIHET